MSAAGPPAAPRAMFRIFGADVVASIPLATAQGARRRDTVARWTVAEARTRMPEIRIPGEGLSDGVVALRPWRRADVPALVEACQDPEIPRWTVVPSPYGEADARGFIAGQDDRRRHGEAVPFAIADADDGRLLGSIELTLHDWRNGRGEVGYWIAAGERRRGVAARAVALISAWAFDALRLGRLELLVEPGNRASQRVAARAGYTREGVLRSYRVMKGRRVDFVLFSLLPGDPLPPEPRAGTQSRAPAEAAAAD